MKTIYAVEGIVNQDFVGQISYTICLKKTYHKMEIGFSFEPQHFTEEDLTPELEEQLTDEILEKYGKTLDGCRYLYRVFSYELLWCIISLRRHLLAHRST